VRRLEEPEDLRGLREVERAELRAVPDVGASRARALPLGSEVAAVGAPAVLIGIFGVARRRGQEVCAAAAERDVDAVARFQLDELRRDVALARAGCSPRQICVALPVAVRRVRVGGGGRRVRESRSRDDAGREPALLAPLEERAQPLLGAARHADRRRSVEADQVRARLHAGEDRGGRPRGLRHLLVRLVGLDQRDVGQALERELVLLAGLATQLAVEDPRRGDRRDAHPVADEDHHVARAAGGRGERARRRDRLAPLLAPRGRGVRVAGGLRSA
jgi:hypothetical protein